jgi:hypothetical protein
VEKEREVRLRQRIEELVRSRVGALEQDISRVQGEVSEAFTRLLERTDAAAVMSDSDQLLAQIAADVTAQIDQASAESVRLGADIALLRDSVAELDEQRTQADVLNALIARASNFAPRVVLFVVKGGNALAWSARGFDDGAGNAAVRGLSVSLQSDTVLRAALDPQQTFYGSPDQQSENHLIFTRLGNVRPQRLLAVPLKVRGKSAAVIYADSADHGEDAINVEAIELLVHTSGMVVELVSLRSRVGEPSAQAARQPAAQPAAPASPAQSQPAASPAATANAPSTARPQAPSGSLTQPVHGTEARPASGALQQPARGAQVERLAPEASPPPPSFFRPAAEPPQAVEPPSFTPPAEQSGNLWGGARGSSGQLNAQSFQAPPAAPSEAAAPVAAQPVARNAAVSEEEKQHNDARRFARLLVSEIKLYNEQKVTEGRRNNDLYDRLKEDIDKSRQMYEKRVTPTVAAKFDYFYDELVNTLAEGDPVKLGSDYPGPSVAV